MQCDIIVDLENLSFDVQAGTEGLSYSMIDELLDDTGWETDDHYGLGSTLTVQEISGTSSNA